MTPPPGDERRPAQRLLRQRGDGACSARDRHADRRRRRHLPRRARPPFAPRRRRPLRQRHPAVSAPSIVLGLFVYTLVVRPTGHFSGFAGALALAMILLPVVVRTTDEMLRLVPTQMREAALRARRAAVEGDRAGPLQAPRCRGIVTGILLGARAHQPAKPRRCCSPRSTTSSGARPDRAARQRAGRDLPVCDEPLRRMARAGLGRRPRPHPVRARR